MPLKIHWRALSIGPAEHFHAFYRISKGHPVGMNFDSLCGRFWVSTVKMGKPRPYPPKERDCCPTCSEKLKTIPHH